jgi:protein-S-isoprenylcysteine O-methyltransferase Ste14
MSHNETTLAEDQFEQNERQAAMKRLLIRSVVRDIMSLPLVAALLFIPAGTWRWPMGWAVVAVYAVWEIAQLAVVLPRSPELVAERASGHMSDYRWDMVILSVMGLITIAKYVVAGLDFRYGWTETLPLALQIAALVFAALGYALGVWTMAANPFFAKVNRIQRERGHEVVSGGPYRWVRHPGYLGTIAFELGTPVALNSWWALIPGGLMVLLTVLRTALEDRALHRDLPGYEQYAQETRYRLVPGMW